MNHSDRLSQFFGGYFHQDWSLDASDWQGVVGLFASGSSPDDVASVAEDIEVLLHSTPSEAELEHKLLEECGCYYTPRPDLGGPSFRQWLSEVCIELRRGVAQPAVQADGPAFGRSAA